ncbi:MAG: glycosyltransferase family 9 protein [Chitinophagales bacterium]
MSAPTKILVIRFSSIGDIVLTTPVVRALHEQLHAEVHFLTKPAFAPLVAANPHIAQVHVLQKSLLDTIQQLRTQQFDLVVDLHHNLRTAIVKAGLMKPAYSFPKRNMEKWLLVQFKKNFLPREHVVDRYMKTIAPLGAKPDGKGLDFFIHSSQQLHVAEVDQHLSQPFLAWVIGAKFGTKQFPPSRIAEVLNHASFPNMPIVLIGGKEDQDAAQHIVACTNRRVFNACGRFGLQQSASIVSQAAAVIANDTGFMHIAAALKRPVISVWGNTVPAFGMTPYYGQLPVKNQAVEVEGLPCRPCSKIGYRQCPQQHFNCMMKINADDLLKALQHCLTH